MMLRLLDLYQSEMGDFQLDSHKAGTGYYGALRILGTDLGRWKDGLFFCGPRRRDAGCDAGCDAVCGLRSAVGGAMRGAFAIVDCSVELRKEGDVDRKYIQKTKLVK
jgi:hypothetical protein